jgi:hypothetical protein
MMVAIFAGGRAQAQEVPVVAAQASSQQVGYTGPDVVISSDGLTEDPPASGQFRLSNAVNYYNSSYGDPNDESPLIHFDFGSTQTINRFRVWNANGLGYTFRGFRDVTVQYSADSLRWITQPERLRFDEAPGTNNYFGQLVNLPRPITARYIRFTCNRTWRGFPQSDIASLGRVKFYAGGSVTPRPTENQRFPLDAGVINVKNAPYGAVGDGVMDDTAAIIRAIRDGEGTDRIIYLPPGTYLVSSTLRFRSNSSSDRNGLFGGNHLQGAGSELTTVRLKDYQFNDAANPTPVIGFGVISFWNGNYEETTADWFNNSLNDLTIDTGAGNFAAKGVEFFSNNTGSIRNVRVISGDGKGAIGMDLGHADKNGPLLVKGVYINGFNTGIRTGQTVNSQTFEDITLEWQRQVAFDNDGQCISIRNLQTLGYSVGFKNRYGFATILDSTFRGVAIAKNIAAITNGEFLFARNVQAPGFGKVIANNYGNGAHVTSGFTGDYLSQGPVLSLFTAPAQSLNLAVQATPVVRPLTSPNWTNIRDYRLTQELDDSLAFQRAIDAGATTIYFPADANIVLKTDVAVKNTVRQLVGFYANVAVRNGARIRLQQTDGSVVLAERFKGVTFENALGRILVLRDSLSSLYGTGTGNIFIENVAGEFGFARNRVWARQLNTEPEGLKVRNAGGQLWILGFKTERAGTLIETTGGGATEVLGGLCYTTTEGTAPMFTVTDSKLGVTMSEISYGPSPYAVLVLETRLGVTKNLNRGDAPFRFSFMNGSAIPLFRAGN